MIYFIIFALLLICVYAFDYKKHRGLYYFAFWGIMIVLIMVMGLRYRIGTDSIVYEKLYADTPTLWQLFNYKFDRTRFEPGYMIFSSIPRSISPDFTFMQIFHALVINLVIFWFILKNTTHRFFCITLYYLIFYVLFCSQVMREALAVCVFLLAWPFLRDGKWLLYYPMALLATFMHLSATITLFIPLFCLPGIRQLFVLGKRTIVICLVIFGLGYYIQQNFTQVLSLFAFTDRMMDRVNNYDDSFYAGGKLNVFGVIMTFFTNCLYPLVALYFQQNKFKNNDNPEEKKRFERMRMMVLLSVFSVIMSFAIFIFNRYYNYFGMFGLAMVSTWMFSKLEIKKKLIKLRPAYWFVIILPLFALSINAYFSKANRSGTLRAYMIYYPYVSRFDPHMDNHREAIFRYYGER